MLRRRIERIHKFSGLNGTRVGVMILAALLALGNGCGARDPGKAASRQFLQELRPASGETARLLQNTRYFRLMGRPQLALQELEEAHQREPANLKVANLLAELSDEVGMGERARQLYQEALTLNPANQAIQNNLCYSYYLAGDWPQAEACFRKALASQPQNQAVRNNLGMLLCRLGRQEEARRLWQEAEGEAVASQKLDQVMAALGTAEAGAPVRAATAGNPPAAERRSSRPLTVAAQPPAPAPGPSHSQGQPSPKPARPESAEPAAASAPKPAESEGAGPKGRVRLAEETVAGPAAQPRHERVLAAARVEPAAPGADPPPYSKISPTSAPRPEATPMASLAASRPPREEARQATPPAAANSTERHNEPLPATPGGAEGSRPGPITARELLETNIAIRNGNGIPELAHETRSRLMLEGFNVASINNHVDFGVERTAICYRPGAERVARALQSKFFRQAELKPVPRLAEGQDVKVILGHDLDAGHRARAGARARQEDES